MSKDRATEGRPPHALTDGLGYLEEVLAEHECEDCDQLVKESIQEAAIALAQLATREEALKMLAADWRSRARLGDDLIARGNTDDEAGVRAASIAASYFADELDALLAQYNGEPG